MRKTLFMVVTTGLFAGAVSLSQGQDWTIPLDERALRQFDAESLEVYNEAWHQIDRAGFDVGTALLSRLARMEPENHTLQFYTAARAMNRANVYYSAGSYTDITDDFQSQELQRATQAPWLIDEIFIDGTINAYSMPPWKISEAFIDIAEASVDNLESLTDLSQEEINRTSQMRSNLEELRANLTVRDTARQEAARPIVEYIFRQRREAFFERADPFDPKNYFDVEERGEIEGILEREAAELSPVEETEYNPFAMLPSQFMEPVFPPQQPVGQPGFQQPQQQFDEFGRPIGAPPPGFQMEGDAMDPFGAGAPPAQQPPQDEFGGAGPLF
ncbi:MAG: hypothetical protein JJU11_00470 [Candidatus Sumerlaeia bacterium]|nr:hypothetical protein [Candidatus Sumerlaeia bacterium]